MQAYRPDRVVKVLTTVVSIGYFVLWTGGAIVLIGAPLAKLFAGDNTDWTFGLPVPTTVQDSGASVVTSWGTARLELEDVRGSLELPVAQLPWWLFVVLWTHTAIGFGLTLLAGHHLRRIFQRVRDGEPFDAHNALRLRWVGLLLLALAVLMGVAEFVTALAVRKGLDSSSIAISTGLHIEMPLVFVALVLVALAEIFRRGAELETEQSLVV